jgi:hypothetical protein
LCIGGPGADDKHKVFSFYVNGGGEVHVYNVRHAFVEGVLDGQFDGYELLAFSDEPLCPQEVRNVYCYDARVIAEDGFDDGDFVSPDKVVIQ